jgi:holo-[acyl-carrier protein] synthase
MNAGEPHSSTDTDSQQLGETFPAPSAPVALAVGVDLLERERLKSTHERFGERFLRRVFTPTELEQAGGRIERLMGRFAAKEACAKALGTGIGAISWQEIEIIRQDSGKPHLRLHGWAAERARALRLTTFDVSISDTATHVMAIVVGVGAGSGGA